MEKHQEVERSIITTYRKRIWGKFIHAIQEFSMVNEGDHIAVCISGGKDSMLLAKCMQELHRHSDVPFEVHYIVMDPGYREDHRHKIEENAKILNIPIQFFSSDIFNVVTKEESNPCYLCARMRRGCLYDFAKTLGCNKIALGHHFDDVIETILIAMFYGSQIQSMLPKLKSTNHPGMELIRPLYFVKEESIIAWKNYNQLEFLQCACRFTENIENGIMDSKRQEIKKLIKELKKIYPTIDTNIFKSTYNVHLDTLIEYKKNGIRHHYLEDYDDHSS